MTSGTSAKLSGGREVTFPELMPQTEQHIWARPTPRGRSKSLPLYCEDSLSFSNFDGPRTSFKELTIPSAYGASDRANEHVIFRDAHRMQLLNCATSPLTAKQQEYQQQARYDCRGRARVQAMTVPMRTGFGCSDPFYQSGVEHNGGYFGIHGSSAGGGGHRLGIMTKARAISACRSVKLHRAKTRGRP